MTTYSTKFFAGPYTGAGGPQTVYTVPTGFVVVVRDIEFFSSNADSFNVQGGPPGSTAVIWLSRLSSAGTWAQWGGRSVLNAGDVITVYSGSTGGQFYVSGYLLST